MNKFLLVLICSFTFVFGVDIDNDLVSDEIDKCLDTPDGVFVNKDGCKQQIKKIVYFNHGLYNINKKEQKNVNNIILLAKEAFGYQLVIEGHTDSIADAQFNMQLSKQRAIAIENILLTVDIDKKRIVTKWYGETMPIASNITEYTRAKNRRVTITFK
ncbi:MAG: OmpA family protein [Campylobacterota bacterium]|nr:OmpA family protein [Campylobacterota bacterium]